MIERAIEENARVIIDGSKQDIWSKVLRSVLSAAKAEGYIDLKHPKQELRTVEDSSVANELGAYLKIRRRELSQDIGERITQMDMAEKVGISYVWYTKIEQGRARRLSLEKFAGIVKACKLTPEESNLFVYAYKAITYKD